MVNGSPERSVEDFYLAEPAEERHQGACSPYWPHQEAKRVYKVLPSISDRGTALVTIQESRSGGVEATDRPNRIMHAAVTEALKRFEQAGKAITSLRVELV